jgi:hypothetical protein
LIRSAYRDSSAYGVMIKTFFLTGACVNEFVHIRVEDRSWSNRQFTASRFQSFDHHLISPAVSAAA